MKAKDLTFSDKIIYWYEKNKRDLPWRNTKDPYKIWLSEIILQQTRVAQGMPYYYRFTETFPDVTRLANASEDQVLRLWQGLGYYSRARNLHAAAKMIRDDHGGKFPDSYSAILKLKGVGDYTAAAIASFAFGLPYAVVDGNVFRVLSRYFGIETDISSSAAKKEFFQLANELIPQNSPAAFNHGIMDFGSMVCTPRQPKCDECPVYEGCFAFDKKIQHELPVKKKKTKVRDRYFHYIIFRDSKDRIYLHQRTGKDIWTGLFQFHLIENDKKFLKEDQILEEIEAVVGKKGVEMSIRAFPDTYRHLLSHQRLWTTFYEVSIDSEKIPAALRSGMYNRDEVDQLAKPVLVNNFLKDHYF